MLSSMSDTTQRLRDMAANENNLLVQNALIFDGFSDQLVEGSILIQDGLITEVGNLSAVI